ncbi:MAG: hypothetical protein K0S39_1948 [Paenibacillus sp.]|jgi:hypothetical protein|nr:hypothetical protein [Paenibacillus sp.]
MNKSDFDAEFERRFGEAAENSEHFPIGAIPEPEASWRALQKRLLKEHRKAVWFRRAKWLSFTAASLMAGALLFSTLQTTEAFRPMFEMVYKMKNNSMNINIRSTESVSTEGAKTPPPPPDDTLPPQKLEDNRDLPDEGSFRRIKVTLEEAVTQTQFAMPVPGFLPNGYTLLEASVHFTMGESKASAAKLVYADGANHSGHIQILVRKRSYSANADRPDGDRSLTGSPKGGNELEWNFQDINIIVKAGLNGQELNRIADGLSAKQ